MEPGRGLLATATGLVALGLLVLSTGGAEVPAAPEAPGVASAPPVPVPLGASRPPAPPVMLPNLRSVGAGDMLVEVADGGRRLRFAASLANLGPGPLHLLPRARQRCPASQHAATQIVYVDATGDGTYQRGRDTTLARMFAGCMLRHRGHEHWHFDAMAGYALRQPGEERPLVSRDKVSFCLRDNRRVSGQPVVVPREHYGECGRTSEQGISPGWIDVYSADLDGQALRIPDGVSGLLCLDLEADPKNLVEETDETDNGTSIAIRVTGTTVRRATARVCAP